ncbi:MAG: alpha/beta fold hydrolase [Acidobacteriota bacterium]
MHVDWKGASIEVREAGSGPTVVLVHGYPLDGGMWSGVARALSTEFRVLKPDLPGRPENPVPAEGTIQSYADFLAVLVSASPPPVGIAGFSMGGYAVLGLLRDHPAGIGAVALLDTRAGADDEAGRAGRQESLASLQTGGAAAVADSMVPKLLSAEARGRADVVERVRRTILRQTAATLQSDLEAMRDRPDRTGFLAEISIPTLVIVGEKDEITPPDVARAMAGSIRGAQFLEIPGSGHATPIERPRAVAGALASFFRAALS